MKENYIVAKPFFSFVVKYLDTECCELSKIEECMKYIESQLLVDEDLCAEDFSICIKKNYEENKRNKFMKEEYLKLLNDFICAELKYWGCGSADHLLALEVSEKFRIKMDDYVDKYAYENALNYDELDLLSGIVRYNNYSKKNWSVDTILEKLESVIERKVR